MINYNLSVKEKVKLMASHFKVKEIEVVELSGVPKGSWNWMLNHPYTAGSHMKRELIDELFNECMNHWNEDDYLKNKLMTMR